MDPRLRPPTIESRTAALVQAVEARRPILAGIMKEHGASTLAQHSERLRVNEAEPIQPREELAEVAANYAAPLLGSETASRLAERLVRTPAVLSANHHGVDFASVTVGGNMVYSLGEEPGGVMPILAGGIVPLNNLTWGRGIILAREQVIKQKGQDDRTAQVRISIFPKADAERLVSATAAFTRKQVTDTYGEIETLTRKGVISEAEKKMMRWVLSQDYLRDDVLSQTSYSDQAVLINSALWKRLFHRDIRDQVPDVAFLEMEKIVTGLLEKDLQNPDSFTYQILFDPNLRAATMHYLNGVYGAWDQERLEALQDPNVKGNDRRKLLPGAGTTFFSGIDDKGRRVALHLVDEDKPYLQGIDDSGNIISLPFTPEDVQANLDRGVILPSLFTSYAEIAFAHGYKCSGGFMQADYLTDMKGKLAQALAATGRERWAMQVNDVPTQNYATGMNHTMVRYGDGSVRPAGSIEMMVHGGLTAADLEKMSRLSVRDANLSGYPGMYPLVYRENERDGNLASVTTSDIHSMVGNKLVEIAIP